MAVGKYRQKHTRYDSKFWGAHEELLTEGISAGRSWAVVRNWYPEPRYRSDRVEKYILRIDISEWYAAYMRCVCVCEMHDEMRKVCMAIKNIKGRNPPCSGVWFENMSPGWWENGFSQQLCLTSTVFKYESEEDRLRSIVKTGQDWDSVDYDGFVMEICQKLDPLFGFFSSIACPKIPHMDDF